jgi:hypothetical protein
LRIDPVTAPKNDATVLLRLPSELKAALTKSALAHGRRITAEINIRLYNSLKEQPEFHDVLSSVDTSDRGRSWPLQHLEREAARAEESTGGNPFGESLPLPPPNVPDDWMETHRVTPLEHRLLHVFRGLPPEKQLALISLFK